MKKVYACARLVGVALAGCSTAFNVSAQAPATRYSSYDCARIAAEQRHIYTRASELASLGDTGAPEADYTRLRAEFDALREAASTKKCQRPTPSLQQPTSDASAALGDTGPRIAPPESPLK